MLSVVVYWILIEAVARSTSLKPPFPGDARVGYAALAGGVMALVIATILRRSLLSRNAAGSLPALQTATILSLACCETAATFGVTAFPLTGRLDCAYPSLVLALLGFAVFFPRRRQWADWAGGRLTPPA